MRHSLGPYVIPLAFAVTSNVFGVSGSFYSTESENIGGEFFNPVYPIFRGPTSEGRKSAFALCVQFRLTHNLISDHKILV